MSRVNLTKSEERFRRTFYARPEMTQGAGSCVKVFLPPSLDTAIWITSVSPMPYCSNRAGREAAQRKSRV